MSNCSYNKFIVEELDYVDDKIVVLLFNMLYSVWIIFWVMVVFFILVIVWVLWVEIDKVMVG